MRSYLLVILIILVYSLAFGQAPSSLPAVQQKMQTLQWLVGKWQGSVEISGQEGKKYRLKQTIEFAPQLKNSLLLINETAVQGQDTVFQNVGLLGYNLSQAKYALQAYTRDGSLIDAQVEVLDKKMIWRFQMPGYILRYTARLNEKGQWHQTGEASTDEGKIWNPFFESTLDKLK